MAGFIRIWAADEASAIDVPYPDNDSALQTVATAVNGAFNGANEFIGQKVGRDRTKQELGWKIMDATLWRQLLQLFDANFVVHVRYYAMAKGIVTREMYVSDRSASPLEIGADGMTWITAKNCKLSVIDTGR